MSETNYYEYQVTFVGNSWDFNIQVQIGLDEDTGNISDEARESAIEAASEPGWLQGIVATAEQIKVKLLLAGEEVEISE